MVVSQMPMGTHSTITPSFSTWAFAMCPTVHNISGWNQRAIAIATTSRLPQLAYFRHKAVAVSLSTCVFLGKRSD